MSTGNRVADYRVDYRTCSYCDGTGYINDIEKCKEWLAEYDLRHTLYRPIYRELLTEGQIDCPNCEKTGTVEVWS